MRGYSLRFGKVDRAICLSAMFVGLVLVVQPFSLLAYGGTDDIGMCDATATELAQSRLSDSSSSVYAFEPRSHRYIDRVRDGDVLIDVRSADARQLDQPFLSLKNVLDIPIFSLKTKTYLKDKRVILLGDGLDNQKLEREVAKLEQARFRFVRILRHGLLNLPLSRFEQLNRKDHYQLYLVKPESLSSAVIMRPQDYHFINLDKATADSTDALKLLGFEHTLLTPINETVVEAKLESTIRNLVETKPNARIVLLHSQLSRYQALFEALPILAQENVLLLDTRNNSLGDVHTRLRTLAKLQQQIKSACVR